MNILVTGGLGYIGSHTVIELINAGHKVTIVDNLSNSDISVHHRLNQITQNDIEFIEMDLRDPLLYMVFHEHQFDAVIHFAGLKSVPESVSEPIKYYSHNLHTTINLLNAMEYGNCHSIVFSSSACVYAPSDSPLTEESKTAPNNPYGQTKLMAEEILRSLMGWNTTSLRYFNPVGCHESGLIGDDPKVPANLMPCITKVATGEWESLTVFGTDYDTRDGTGERDYIHVVDLAKGHVAALEKLEGHQVFNLGTGRGHTVLEVLQRFITLTGERVEYTVGPRREGDIDSSIANNGKAQNILNFECEKPLDDMILDSYRWQKYAMDLRRQ